MLAMTEAQMRKCLTDAGGDAALTGQFKELRCSGRRKDQIRLLNGCRRQLSERIHAEQKKRDCLDYLIYAVKSNASV